MFGALPEKGNLTSPSEPTATLDPGPYFLEQDGSTQSIRERQQE